MTAPERKKLPDRHESIIEKIEFAGVKYHLGFSYDPAEPRVAAVWVDGPKAGSDLQAACHDAAAVVSIALQYGIPVAELADTVDMPHGQPVSTLGAVLQKAAEVDRDLRRRVRDAARTAELASQSLPQTEAPDA